MKIVLIEDDRIQASFTIEAIERQFGQACIEHYTTASDFLDRLGALGSVPPDLFVFDMMLRWSNIDTLAGNPAPPDFTYNHAGIYCAKAVLALSDLVAVPIIIHTFVSSEHVKAEFGDMPPRVSVIGKEENPQTLVMMMRSIILASGSNAIAPTSKDIFIVHGHDDEAKETVARFIEKLGANAVILHEQPNLGRAIIEKFEHYSNVAFAIVLLTPDDVGGKNAKSLKQRARQNVVFELGFFFAKLGRSKVCALYKGDVEIPSDYEGVLYTEMDKGGAWRTMLARELKAAGIPLDYDKLI